MSEPAVAEPLYVSALVAYDGAGFHGFQHQANAASVQRELEAALDQVTERTSRIVGAGRTDAGVHASGQVIAVSVRWKHQLAALQRAWNVHLPPTVTVRRVQAADPGFHPRFSALSRTYRYVVWQYEAEPSPVAPFRSPLTDRYSLLVGKLPALAAMQEAAGLFVGSHDFATFGQPMRAESTVRVVHTAEWRQVEETLPTLGDYPGRRLVFTITANAFLRRMVRSMVGTLLAVGRGEWSVDEVAAALAARDRRRAAPPAPPQGLNLEKVTYPAELDAQIHGK